MAIQPRASTASTKPKTGQNRTTSQRPPSTPSTKSNTCPTQTTTQPPPNKPHLKKKTPTSKSVSVEKNQQTEKNLEPDLCPTYHKLPPSTSLLTSNLLQSCPIPPTRSTRRCNSAQALPMPVVGDRISRLYNLKGCYEQDWFDGGYFNISLFFNHA